MTQNEAKAYVESELKAAYERAEMVGHKGKTRYVKVLELVLQILEQEPKTGHWVKTPKAVMGEGYMWYCDKCEHQVYQDTSRPYPSENYCPNCGADMRGEI